MPTEATVLGRPAGERVLVWGGFPLVGAVLGWLLRFVADWAVSLPWVPFQGPLELVASVPEPQGTLGGLALGAGAGVVVAFLAAHDYVTVTVDDSEVTLTKGDTPRRVPRVSVEAVFVSDKRLVLLGGATEELARQGGDLPSRGRLEAAFLAHGYPWRAGGDPHHDEYRSWVEDHPDLSDAANALLKARARTLEKGGTEDAEQLRTELGELGIVVREENKRQYWRPTR